MIGKEIFPLANEDQQEHGWTFSCAFLTAIREAAETHGFEGSCEDVEAVLTAVQAHVLLAINADKQDAIAQAVAEKTELIQRLADEKCRCFLERATKAEAAERQRCAAILREHICNYCDHDHA